MSSSETVLEPGPGLEPKSMMADAERERPPAQLADWSGPGAMLWRLGDDLLEATFNCGFHLTLDLVREVSAAASALCPEGTLRVLIDISGLTAVDRNAVAALAAFARPARIALFGGGPADEVLARFVIGALPPDSSLRFFPHRTEALYFLAADA
ncbi:hypothetical protein ACQ3I4_12460 [Zafaria sp. Z1313]|uniref:DUF7793 family protein n=1 Tax=Zafaria sp. Z1313 TaxID=3423202 RepID=UPI003D30353B